MEIPLIKGIYTSQGVDVRVSHPVNMVPTVVDSGISASYLKPADGIVSFATGQGNDRAGIFWNDGCYRVSGSSLILVDSSGSSSVLGDVGGASTKFARLDYGFDRLMIVSDKKLFYWNGALTQVSDADLGKPIDGCWLGGYYVTTDGESIIVTDLNDPTAINPLKYGSSESDPDNINALHRLRNELVAVNRHTIELFENVGGSLFPFQRIEGAQIQKGAVSTRASCIFMDMIAFVGGSRNEGVGVHLGANATTQKISTQEIDDAIALEDVDDILVECKIEKDYQHLLVHLSDRTLCFDYAASQALGTQVWFTLTSSAASFAKYKAINHVRAFGKWICGNPSGSQIGYLSGSTGEHYGDIVRWEIATPIVYLDGSGGIINSLELVSLTGRNALGVDANISTSYSLDGMSWSQNKSISAGSIGNTLKRLVWFGQGFFRHWRIQRFTGDSQSRLSVIRLEAKMQAAAY